MLISVTGTLGHNNKAMSDSSDNSKTEINNIQLLSDLLPSRVIVDWNRNTDFEITPKFKL